MILEVIIANPTDKQYINFLKFCESKSVKKLVCDSNDKNLVRFLMRISKDLSIPLGHDTENSTHTYRINNGKS